MLQCSPSITHRMTTNDTQNHNTTTTTNNNNHTTINMPSTRFHVLQTHSECHSKATSSDREQDEKKTGNKGGQGLKGKKGPKGSKEVVGAGGRGGGKGENRCAPAPFILIYFTDKITSPITGNQLKSKYLNPYPPF